MVMKMRKKKNKTTEFQSKAFDPLGTRTGTDVTDGVPVQDADDL